MELFFCNVAWLENYNGPEPENISGGGAYVEKNNKGAEQFNFFDISGKYKGYVSTQGHQIKIERLNARKGEPYTEDNILVVWVAQKPQKGAKIIGWYKNARVYRNYQKSIDGYIYNIESHVENSVLLPISKRKKAVPRASVVGKGKGMGQSNYWFANHKKARSFVKEVKDYINNYSGKKLNKKESSLKKLKNKGFKIDDEVKIKQNIHLTNNEDISLSGLKGKIKASYYNKDELTVYIKIKKEDINNMSQEYLDKFKEENFSLTCFPIYVSQINKVKS